jgi:TonB family protein
LVMKREIAGSAIVHVVLFFLLVLVTAPDASLPPPVPADQVMNVTPVDALPASMLKVPDADVPVSAPDVSVPDASPSVKIPEPEPVAIPDKPRPSPEPKVEQPKPEIQATITPPVEEPPVRAEAGEPSDGVYESRVQKGTGAEGGSLLGIRRGTPGGRPSTYPDRVTNKVFFSWKNPSKLLDTATCSVVFRIDAEGHATQVALEQSSGMAVFDNSTVRAVYEAAPYPPFPRSMKDQYIVMRIIFEYTP